MEVANSYADDVSNPVRGCATQPTELLGIGLGGDPFGAHNCISGLDGFLNSRPGQPNSKPSICGDAYTVATIQARKAQNSLRLDLSHNSGSVNPIITSH